MLVCYHKIQLLKSELYERCAPSCLSVCFQRVLPTVWGVTLTPVGVTTAGVNPDTASTRPPASVSVSTPQPSANLGAIALTIGSVLRGIIINYVIFWGC